MVDLPAYLKGIAGAYESIAEQIKNLLVILNDKGLEGMEHQQLAERINGYLAVFEEKVCTEGLLVRTLSPEQRKKFLALLNAQIKQIKRLRLYVRLSETKPTPEIIKVIHALNTKIETEIAGEEALAGA